MTAASIRAKLDAALNKLVVSEKPVYKRVRTRTGGDRLLGVGETITVTDTLLSPYPAILSIDQNDRAWLSGAKTVMTNDQRMIVTTTAITRPQLADKNLSIVLKDGSGEVEYSIEYYDPIIIYSTVLAFNVLLRPTKG